MKLARLSGHRCTLSVDLPHLLQPFLQAPRHRPHQGHCMA